TNFTATGTFRGQCAELCGQDHGFMPIVVVVKSKADFAKWLAEQETPVAAPAAAEPAAADAAPAAAIDTALVVATPNPDKHG
ncbi:MAG: cytochrome c oxidase subunit II, partial [Rhodanobacter sp.]